MGTGWESGRIVLDGSRGSLGMLNHKMALIFHGYLLEDWVRLGGLLWFT